MSLYDRKHGQKQNNTTTHQLFSGRSLTKRVKDSTVPVLMRNLLDIHEFFRFPVDSSGF